MTGWFIVEKICIILPTTWPWKLFADVSHWLTNGKTTKMWMDEIWWPLFKLHQVSTFLVCLFVYWYKYDWTTAVDKRPLIYVDYVDKVLINNGVWPLDLCWLAAVEKRRSSLVTKRWKNGGWHSDKCFWGCCSLSTTSVNEKCLVVFGWEWFGRWRFVKHLDQSTLLSPNNVELLIYCSCILCRVGVVPCLGHLHSPSCAIAVL